MCERFRALCSIFIGGVSRKNNRDVIVGVFIWEKVWLKNSLSQSDGGVTGSGHIRVGKQACGGQRPQAEASSTCVREERRCVGARKVSHGMVETKMLYIEWLSLFRVHLRSLPSTACFSTQTRPLPIPPPSDWLRLFSSRTFSHVNTPTISSWLFFLLTPPTEMEQTECSEMSAYKIQAPGNYPEESIQHLEHGVSLKSRILEIYLL
jgi:hypothetical protein